MNATQTKASAGTRLLTMEGLKEYLSCGRSKAVEIAEAASAKRKIGGRALYDRVKIDAYLDTLTE